MAPRALSLALLLAGLISLPAFAAEKQIGRQVQTWRPRPLSPLLPEPPQERETTQAEPPRPRIPLDAWIKRILSGQPLVIVKPTWKGCWPTPQNPWTLALTPGIRGDVSAGFGAELTTEGAWTLAGIRFEGASNVLVADSHTITSWRARLSRQGASLEVRGWFDQNFRPGELATTAAYRRSF